MPTSTLEGVSQVTYASAELVSVVFDLSNYNYPAAHPNFWRRTLTFTLKPVAELLVDDIFEYDTNFVPRLIELCDEQIKKEFEGEFDLATFSPVIDDWQSDDASRFKLFNVTKEGLSFSFVGPFVVKIAQATIPFSVLSPYLSRRTPVWKLAYG